MKKNKKNCFKIAAISFLGIGIFLFREFYMAGLYLYNIAVSRSDKAFLTKFIDLEKEENALIEDITEEKDELLKWIENTPKREYRIWGYNKTKLYGIAYLQKRKSDKWVIIVHGYGGNGNMMNYAAKEFYKEGFNVIVPDCRGHGKSEGKYIGMGYHDGFDIFNWVNKIVKSNSESKIVLYGVSMGAAAVMMSAGLKNLPENVKCVIEDSGYTSAYEIFKIQLKSLYKLPALPFLILVSIICKLKNGYCIRDVSPLKSIKNCKIPVLFLHGEKDNFVPPYMANKLYKRANVEKSIHITKGAGHGVSFVYGGRGYWKRIFDFINNTNRCFSDR